MQISMKAARHNANMTQHEMAEKMGVTVATVSHWEKGKRDLSAKDFAKFCDIVGMSRDDIFLPEELTNS